MKKNNKAESDLDFIKRKVLTHDTLLQNHVMAMERLIKIMENISFDLDTISKCMEENSVNPEK